MNRTEFFNAAKPYLGYLLPNNETAEELEKELLENYDRNNCDPLDTKAIVDFADWCSLYMRRPEVNSDDVLEISIGAAVSSVCFWEDIGKAVCYIGYIGGCAGIIHTLYISEDGKFYDHKHKILAENEEEFLDYLLTVEFDFHPIIGNPVIEVLKEAGWYEGRSVDVSKFAEEFERRCFRLTDAQLDFLREFSGLNLDYESEILRFFSLDRIAKDYFSGKEHVNWSLPANHDLSVGTTTDFWCSVDPGGIIKVWGIPQGRTAMECVNHLIRGARVWGFNIDEPMDPGCTFIEIEKPNIPLKKLSEVTRVYTSKQIVMMTSKHIVFNDGKKIDFDECVSEWGSFYFSNNYPNCVGERNIIRGDKPDELPYFIFWTKERIKLVFHGDALRTPAKNYLRFCDRLEEHGYSSYDIT